MRTTPAQVHGYMDTLRKHYGVQIEVWTNSPGDGVKRWRFTTKIRGGRIDRTCLGSAAAFEYLSGIQTGKEALR